RDAVQPDIEAERKKRDEIEAGKSYCSRRFGGATCDDKSAQIYARFDKNDWRIQPAEFYRFHDASSTTSIDIMGLQAAYANLHTDQERDYFMQRYHDVISSFGGKTSYDADNRPLLVMRSNLWA